MDLTHDLRSLPSNSEELTKELGELALVKLTALKVSFDEDDLPTYLVHNPLYYQGVANIDQQSTLF